MKSALVEFDQLFIQMQILDHRTHLEVEPLSKHLVRPVFWPLLLISSRVSQVVSGYAACAATSGASGFLASSSSSRSLAG